jgi:2-polyprenyl-3-methyl-5-hydroxy-6-metoxy-1,4-benzoquinol methylase
MMGERTWAELNDEVREVWDANAEFWDGNMGEGNAFHRQLIAPAVERLLNLQPDERVLEFACGNGQFSRRMAELGATVTASDIAPRMIEVARRHTAERPELANRISFDVLDATREVDLAPLGECQFDAAVCLMAIMDMAEISPMLRAVRRGLVPQGRFVFALTHPCFNHAGIRLAMEEEIKEGEVIVQRAVKVVTYKTTGATKGTAMIGQPRLQWYFDRTLSELLSACFAAGFVLDGLEEPAFPAGETAERQFGWQAYSEIPPILAARLRPA